MLCATIPRSDLAFSRSAALVSVIVSSISGAELDAAPAPSSVRFFPTSAFIIAAAPFWRARQALMRALDAWLVCAGTEAQAAPRWSKGPTPPPFHRLRAAVGELHLVPLCRHWDSRRPPTVQDPNAKTPSLTSAHG